jgi:hypothetical protein
MPRRAREASVVVISCVASAAMALMANRRSASASSMSVLHWMMQALSHCLSSGWPDGSGSRSSGNGLHAVAGGGLPSEVVPLA